MSMAITASCDGFSVVLPICVVGVREGTQSGPVFDRPIQSGILRHNNLCASSMSHGDILSLFFHASNCEVNLLLFLHLCFRAFFHVVQHSLYPLFPTIEIVPRFRASADFQRVPATERESQSEL